MYLVTESLFHRDGSLLVWPGDHIEARYEAIYRRTGSLGGIPISEATGTYDRHKVYIRTKNDDDDHTRGAVGPLTISGIHGIVRIMREPDVATLSEVDKRIAETEELLLSLRGDRRAFLESAFNRGEHVDRRMVTQMADELTPSDKAN